MSRRFASERYDLSMSKPTNDTERRYAAKADEPRPRKGSIASLVLDIPWSLMHISGSWTGNVEGCGLSCSLLWIVWYGMNHVFPLQCRSVFADFQRPMFDLSW